MSHQIKITDDGSATLYLQLLNEHYHSTHGACQESMHVFINAGLFLFKNVKNEINILEVGMGTGLNVLLTARFAEDNKININYLALEPFPIDDHILRQLNYEKLPALNIPENWIDKVIDVTKSSYPVKLHSGFHLFVMKQPLEEIIFLQHFDLIYFDAFGPQVQPEIWSEKNFSKIFNAMNPGGILVTYCAKGAVRRVMKNIGFNVERLPGPPGKREMLRAKKGV